MIVNPLFRRATPLLLIAVGLVALGTPSAHADLIVTSTSRSVTALATGAPGDGDTTALTGLYVHSSSAIGSSPAGTISSGASQSSNVPSIGPAMGGTGTVSTHASATGFTGFSNLADSFFDVFFDVSSTGFYNLDASVNWSGAAPPFGGFASVQLKDVSSAIIIDTVFSDLGSPGVHELHDAYFLTAGIHYRLTAEAKIDGGFATAGEYGASGGWSVTLVPEPSTLALAAFGFIGMAAWRLRRKR